VSDVSPVPTRSDQQGKDFLSYHVDQHSTTRPNQSGGSAPLSQAFNTLDPNLRGSAMLNGIDKAIADSALLHDDTLATQYSEQGAADQSGGKRRRKRRATKRRGQRRRRQSQRKRRNQRGGGGMPPLGFEPVGASGRLLDNMEQYSRAGLNPDYYKGTSTEQWAADMRDRS